MMLKGFFFNVEWYGVTYDARRNNAWDNGSTVNGMGSRRQLVRFLDKRRCQIFFRKTREACEMEVK